jgi:hypothetical protein
MGNEKKTIVINFTRLKETFIKVIVSLFLGFGIVLLFNRYNFKLDIIVLENEETSHYYHLLDKEYNLWLEDSEPSDGFHEKILSLERRIPINALRIINPSYFRGIHMADINLGQGYSGGRFYLSDFISNCYGGSRHNIFEKKRFTCIYHYSPNPYRVDFDYSWEHYTKKFRNPLNTLYFSMMLSFYDWIYMVLFALIIFVFWIFFTKYKVQIK